MARAARPPCRAPRDHRHESSRAAFEKQFAVPGLVMFRASVDGSVVGLHLWYLHRGVAYGHLGATNPTGYKVMASYALYLVRDPAAAEAASAGWISAAPRAFQKTPPGRACGSSRPAGRPVSDRPTCADASARGTFTNSSYTTVTSLERRIFRRPGAGS